MITTQFDYSVPASLAEALQKLDAGAKPLAGGMSLIPMMKLRFAQPEALVDIARLSELRYVRESGGKLEIGATATHHDLLVSPLVNAKCPLLSECAGEIGDIQVRNAGTIGGSAAHNDPAADYPAVLLALEAEFVLRSSQGQRTVAAEDFFVDTLTTCLEPGELITAIHVPIEAQSTGTRYQKSPHPASGYAMVGIAVRLARSGGKISMARVGVTGLSGKAYRAKKVEAALLGKSTVDEMQAAAALVAEGVDASSDTAASAEYRAHLARVQTARAVSLASERSA
jgi:aerobic carbon-monoxide dehydrogenase medium subunit